MRTHQLSRLMRELSDSFVTSTRTDGTKYTHCADTAPDWVSDVVHACHGHMGPDDWRYRMIAECAGDLCDYAPDEWQESLHEVADSLVDIYTSQLLQWLASRNDRTDYIDDARREGLIDADADETNRIMIGQYQEYMEILQAMMQAIETVADDNEPTWADFVASCGHMQPVIEHGDYFAVETTAGTEIVPASLAYAPKCADDMRDYIEGEPLDIDAPVERLTGYLARMTAPGYMDCTDWTAHASESDAQTYLMETYGE